MHDTRIAIFLLLLALSCSGSSRDEPAVVNAPDKEADVHDAAEEMTNLEEARVIFMRYGGDFFGMHREGELDRYESFRVSKAQEEVWLGEFRQEALAKLRKQPADTDAVWDFCNTIGDGSEFDAIVPLVIFAEDSIGRLDTFSKVRYAEEFIDSTLEQEDPIDPKIREKVLQVVRMLLESAVKEPVTVAEFHLDKYPNATGVFGDIYSDEAVRSRAKRSLERLDE